MNRRSGSVFSARSSPNPTRLIYNTEAKKNLCVTFFTNQTQQVAGVGVNIPQHIDKQAFKRKQGLMEDYFYYGGRIDAGKGCQELIEFYLRKRNETPNLPLLILSGHLSMELPRDPSIIYLGYFSEQEKEKLLQGALSDYSFRDGKSFVVIAGKHLRRPLRCW